MAWDQRHESRAADETSAVGTSRYVELVNSKFAIYGKAGNTPISTGSLGATQRPARRRASTSQVISDPTTSRFYYAMHDILSAKHNRWPSASAGARPRVARPTGASTVLDFGGCSPTSRSSATAAIFAIIGVNVFANNNSNRCLGSDLAAISKPPAGSSCPPHRGLQVGDSEF